MTVSNPSIDFNNSTSAFFRAWGLAVSTALQAVGLVKTADTGQIDFASVAAPGAGSTSAGYEMYRLNDGLQATKPVFMKIEYGSGTNSGNQPALWISFGTSTNGAGTFNGLLTTPRRHMYAGNLTSTGMVPCYFASDGSYLTMLLNPGSFAAGGNPFQAMVLFDRTRDAANAITSEGFQYAHTANQGTNVAPRLSAMSFGSVGAGGGLTNFAHGVLSFRTNSRGEVGPGDGNTTTYQGCMFFQIPAVPAATATYLGDTYFFQQVLTAPYLCYSSLVMAAFTNDLGANLTTITAPVLGATHTYLVVPLDLSGVVPPGSGTYSGGTSLFRTLVRYE